jgi:hypothetical protein
MRVFDNAQGRKARGRCYGDCLGHGVVDGVLFRVDASDIDVLKALENGLGRLLLDVEQARGASGGVEAIRDCQHGLMLGNLMSAPTAFMVVLESLG